MSFNIKDWNLQIQGEIHELEIHIENEKMSLQEIQTQIDQFTYVFGPYIIDPHRASLISQKDFIASSIKLLEQNVLQLRSKIISCC